MKPFDNNIRNYPNFKSTFGNFYEKHYGLHAVIVLRERPLTGRIEQCKPLSKVDEIFDCIDAEFGNHGKLTELRSEREVEDIEEAQRYRGDSIIWSVQARLALPHG